MAIPLKHIEGKYEILEKLQEGGVGALYKVRHRLLGELRVVKVLRPRLQGDPNLRLRFLAEARAATRLGHPNIAQIYDCSVDDDGVAFIVMELIGGMTLAELSAVVARPPLALTLEIARQGLRAIRHLHRHGVAHRDISPDNLMLTRDVDGRPLLKLIDLGIAKDVDGDGRLTGDSVFLGKFRYAAPETFEDQAPSDPRRSDLYAFALVLYELLTGVFPIAGESASSLIAGHLFRPPLDFAEADPEDRVPEPVRRAVLRALAKPPGERFADAEDFAAALLAGAEVDLSSPEVLRVLDLTQDDQRRPEPVARRPGSTQSRLDLQFGIEPTGAAPVAGAAAVGAAPAGAAVAGVPAAGAPVAEDAPTRLLRPAELPGLEEEETRILKPAAVPAAAAETRRLGVDQVRAMQVEELTARARDRARAEDFPAARDLLLKALELAPDDPTAATMLASVEACIAASRWQAPAPADLGAATERFDDDRLRRLREEASGTREPAADEDSTTAIKVQTAAPDGDRGTGDAAPRGAARDEAPPAGAAPAALDETLRTIRALRDDGRAGEALERLNRAVREFGSQPTLRTLRDELGEALLARDEEEESASQIFEVAPAGDEEPTVLSAAAPGAAPRAEAKVRGLSDATIRSFDAPSRQPRERPGPPTAPATRNMLAAGLALAVGLAAVVFLLTRDRAADDDREPLAARDVAAIAPSPGSLALDAVPWAEIVALEDPAAEESPPIAPSRFTPVVLRLPPGEYRITLRYPPTGHVEERVVRVDSDVRLEQRVIFENLDAGAYFERVW